MTILPGASPSGRLLSPLWCATPQHLVQPMTVKTSQVNPSSDSVFARPRPNGTRKSNSEQEREAIAVAVVADDGIDRVPSSSKTLLVRGIPTRTIPTQDPLCRHNRGSPPSGRLVGFQLLQPQERRLRISLAAFHNPLTTSRRRCLRPIRNSVPLSE